MTVPHAPCSSSSSSSRFSSSRPSSLPFHAQYFSERTLFFKFSFTRIKRFHQLQFDPLLSFFPAKSVVDHKEDHVQKMVPALGLELRARERERERETERERSETLSLRRVRL